MNSSKIDSFYNFLRRKPPKGPPSARESDQFHILVEQSSDGIMVTDRDWVLLDVNTSGCLIFGYDRPDLQRRAFGELVAGEELPKLELIGKALRTGDSVLCSLNCRRRGGCSFPAQVNLRPLMDGRIQIILRDMTQKGRMQARLEASEARYRAIVEDQTEFIRRFKPDLTLTYVNPAFCKYFGKNQFELLGKSFLDLVPPEDHASVSRQVRELSRDRPVAVAERRSVHAGDEERWQQWVNRAIFDDAGTIIEYQSVGRDITEQKRIERRLKESEVRYRAIVEDQTELIRRFRPDLTLTYVNPAFCKYFGTPEGELLGKSFLALFPVEDHGVIRRQIEDLSAKHPVAEAERRWRGTGGERWQLWVNRGICDDSGAIVEYQSVGRDITEQKVIERRLTESEARYRAIVEDQTEFIRRFKPDLTLTYVNPAFCRYFGRRERELLGKSFLALIPDEDHDLVRAQIRALCISQPVGVAERRTVMQNGEERWQHWVNRAIFGEDGEIVEYQSVGRDMTAYKRMEEQLKKSESRYRAIVEDQTDLIRRFTPDGTLTFVNSAFCRFYQKDFTEILGSNFESLIPPQDRERIANQIYSLTPETPTCITEPRYYKPDGTLSWLQYVNRGIYNSKGEVIEYQSVGRDITAQKEAETKVQEAREAIERATRVTTLAVIGGGIAHEINQPLNAVKILVGTLSYLIKNGKDAVPDSITQGLNDIGEQIDRIDAIVNHLRLFLRKSQNFEYIPCNLNEIVETALALVANQLFSKRIRVKKLLAPTLPPICGSSVRFEEIVLNLIMNAVDALEGIDKRRKITIQTWAEEDGVHLVVSDTGRGVAPEVAEKIFEPFFSTKKQGANMGLGLSIVHSIVVASNGTIRIENLPGGGTAVSVRLPAARDGAEDGACCREAAELARQ